MSSNSSSESDTASDSSFTSPPTTPRDGSTSNVAEAVCALGNVPSILRGLLPVVSSNAYDERDVGTPDEWVQRDPRLIRLTGKHPLNAEAKLHTLFNAGFVTPTELFFVRSHGAVPKIEDTTLDNWKVSVVGLVANPMELSVRELQSQFPVVTLPITLVCAGNRRKEQNIVRKGLGFNWGAAGVSTALFTGVYLADVLEAAKPTSSGSGARPKHVIFEGGDSLPQGPYGTSQRLSWARDKSRGILIAWAMNGLPLTPDHGFPIRVVVPGQIGGRSVKWLRMVKVSDEESQHYLHFYDNKVLPTQVTPEQAKQEDRWWHNQAYIINDLNVNSAIAQPDHDEVLDLTSSSAYAIKGYAYSGGGRRVTRVEISLDEGDTWRLAEITYPEDLCREIMQVDQSLYGTFDAAERDTCLCWCFWTYWVPTSALKDVSAVMVRAMDEALALQPRDMCINWWFRVAVHHMDCSTVRFEHPTLAGTASGGWMERLKSEGQDILKPKFGREAASVPHVQPQDKEVIMKGTHVDRTITLEQLQAHRNLERPWFVVQGEVYDGTAFLKDHPGGPDSITLVAGEDATEDFMAIHSSAAKSQLAEYALAVLTSAADHSQAIETIDSLEPSSTFLVRNKWKSATLSAIYFVSHDTKLFRFDLGSRAQALGLASTPTCFQIKRTIRTPDGATESQVVQRAYTPVSTLDANGHVDLLIKLYLPNQEWPSGGKMSDTSSELSKLRIGDQIELKGPFGSFVWRGRDIAVSKLAMICGGSGITPIIQVLRGVFNDQDDHKTEVWLIDANKTEEDIIFRDELDMLADKAGGRLRLHHVLSRTKPRGWPYSSGLVNQQIMADHLPPPSLDVLALVCGPDPMVNLTVKPVLVKLGWDVDEQVVIF
ncbi:nitrate reductase [Hymenopellis radicata]|nr:nitrate reductase [Hymenopellis radicata]